MAKKSHLGQLVAFEGIFTTGKTTQLEALRWIAEIERLDVHICETWDYPAWDHDALDFITNPNLDVEREDLYQQEVEILKELYQQNDIDKRISNGQTVVIDQYLMGMKARFPLLGIDPYRLEYDLADMQKADMTFYFDSRPRLAISRAKEHHVTDAQKLNEEYIQMMRENYLELKDKSVYTVQSNLPRIAKHEFIRGKMFPTIMFNPENKPPLNYLKKGNQKCQED